MGLRVGRLTHIPASNPGATRLEQIMSLKFSATTVYLLSFYLVPEPFTGITAIPSQGPLEMDGVFPTMQIKLIQRVI